MGYSCTKLASIREQAISDACYRSTGTSNGWIDTKNGNRYFYQIGRENSDGSITGSIHKHIKDDPSCIDVPERSSLCCRSGSFRIDRDGKGFRGPAFMKNIKAYELFIDNRSNYRWDEDLGEPTEESLWKAVSQWAKSLELGGCNQHISLSKGFIPYPTKAHVVCINDGSIVVTWKAGMFQAW